MPPIRFAPRALQDLQRLREFLRPKNPEAARRAGLAIQQDIRVLGQQPRIGRMIEDMPEHFREWPIHFGDSGYVARYRIDPDGSVTILTIWHQREAATPSS